MRQRLKRFIFALLGKDPEAVVVSFLTGEAAPAMAVEAQRLIPGRRHFAIRLAAGAEVPGATLITLKPGSTWQIWRQLHRAFRRYRIGMAPVLFTADRAFAPLRRAAFLLAPTRILGYNARLERHHLQLSTPIASCLFLAGVPLDRIFLRPRWLFPWKKDRSSYPATCKVLDGRPLSPLRQRVAVLSPYFPYPLSHGGAVRIFQLLREAAREFDLFLFAFTEVEAEEAEPVLEFCARVVLVPKPRYREPRWATLAPPEACEYDSPLMRRLLNEVCREHNIALVQVEYTHLAPYGGHVLVEHDVTHDLYRQIYERERSLSAWWNWWRWQRFERSAVRRFRQVVAMSEKDAMLLRPAAVTVIPNGVDLERFHPEPEAPGQRLLFIGSFRHFPNAAAYRFFAEEVWPLVRARLPEATLTVVAGPDPLIHWRAWAGTLAPPAPEGIRLLGFVRDVRPLYVEANLVIVPTVVSAGTNLKVLEAMAMERAVVSTTSGCAGLGLEHGVSVWIADQPADFADRVANLLPDPELRRATASAARRHAEVHYGWRGLGAAQRGLWRDLLRPPIRIRRAGERDLPEIARIQALSPGAAVWEPRAYLGYECRVAVAGERVAGFVVWRLAAELEGEVLNLAVAPELRRHGVASRLIEEVLGSRPGAWFLEVRASNAPARRLYQKLGFQEVARREDYYRDPAEAAVVMRRESC
ncbi:MAG: GNAT family N-acetyltransferase [Acidobacteriota bacterium]